MPRRATVGTGRVTVGAQEAILATSAAPGRRKGPQGGSAGVGASGGRSASKYGAKRVEQDGITFSSKREAARWKALQLLERAGAIRDLQRQVSYDLHADGGNLVGRYIADHVYREETPEGWELVIEDVKGMPTPLYDWKRRHMAAQYGIVIREV